jgi:hypothetical protein
VGKALGIFLQSQGSPAKHPFEKSDRRSRLFHGQSVKGLPGKPDKAALFHRGDSRRMPSFGEQAIFANRRARVKQGNNLRPVGKTSWFLYSHSSGDNPMQTVSSIISGKKALSGGHGDTLHSRQIEPCRGLV